MGFSRVREEVLQSIRADLGSECHAKCTHYYFRLGTPSRGWRSTRNLSARCIRNVLRYEYGAPCTRRRIYILMVNYEVLAPAAMEFKAFAERVAGKLKCPPIITWKPGRSSHQFLTPN